ncbi:hypothetical protein GALMADRAFT_244802 [Galerina marginata CBS 339.88]|uniref:REJ domain-containing protein n=1 Tax=Galerina marginata (strain CBS 339.88) TaxID=685588 RepID=A0A067T9M8_GALM3|nr:hypothetical protein GALMADRAFT_244802 [Galerina marginata CBS 339.88]
MRVVFLAVAALLLLVHAQTITTTNADGQTVVQVVTTILGVATTQVIQTLSPASLPASSASSPSAASAAPAAPTTAAPQLGPVGQPASTTGTPGGPTPYTYTTVVGGVTTSVVDTFTPTSPATLPVSIGSSGTILDYSSWLSVYGPPKSSTSAGVALSPRSALMLLFACLPWSIRALV